MSVRRTERLSSFLFLLLGETIPVSGRPFTWKRRVNGSWIYEKLDRGIARCDFSRLYPNLCASHGSFTFSDHCPIIISTDPDRRSQKQSPFRFQSFWTNYYEVHHMVRQNWHMNIKGSKMYSFVKKMQAVKSVPKPWAKSKFGHIQDLSLIHI